MNLRQRVFPVNRWLEPLLATIILTMLGYALWHLYEQGYLPQPYFFEHYDTWMDWFNTAYWAHNGGVYEVWRSVYFPLSFVMLKALTYGQCYTFNEITEVRSCDFYGIFTMHAIFLLNIPLTYFTFRKIEKYTAVPRTIAITLGLPMTYTLDRGNLLLITYSFMLLAYGPVVKSARMRWLFAGLAVNMKIYLIGTLFAQLLRHRWRWFEGAVGATLLIYLITFALLGEGTPFQIANNLRDFSSVRPENPLDAWNTSTYLALSSILELSSYPVVSTLGSDVVEFFVIALPASVHVVQATILFAAAAAWFRPGVVQLHRLLALSIGIALITVESGGYTQILLLLFVFMERWRGFGRKWALVIAYILCIPADIPIQTIGSVVQQSFWSGRDVYVDYKVTVGHLLRPGLSMSIPFALALVTLREVLADARKYGWSLKGRYRPASESSSG